MEMKLILFHLQQWHAPPELQSLILLHTCELPNTMLIVNLIPIAPQRKCSCCNILAVVPCMYKNCRYQTTSMALIAGLQF